MDWKAGIYRFLLLYALWLIISEGRPALLAVGLPACLATTVIGHAVWRRSGRSVSLVRLMAYVPGFLWRSIKGGVDVGWRVLHPRLPIAPAFVSHECRESDETGRALFCDVLSLMPGTLGVGLSGTTARVHVLVDDSQTRRLIEDEDLRVATVLGDVEEGWRRTAT